MNFDQVSAVIVTRGDVVLQPIIASLPFDDIVVWDNSKRTHDLKVFGRYAAVEEAQHGIIYVQDDDCILDYKAFGELLDAYEPDTLIANMPERFRAHYSDSCLVGFGALFDRVLPARAFERWKDHFAGTTDAFARCCDVVFTALTPQQKWLDLGYVNLPYASDDTRMWRQPNHVSERSEVLNLSRAIRG